jgi:hypothetical protein
VLMTVEEALQAGYHYFLVSIHHDYINSMWTNKKAAEAAYQDLYCRSTRNFYTPLVIVADKDL